MHSNSQFQQLIEHNLLSFVEAFQLDQIPYLQPLLKWYFMTSAKEISETIIGYDRQIAEQGLAQGSRWLLENFSTTVKSYNADLIPKSGPVLIVSNHPGMTDAMSIFATLPREDIVAVGRKNPILSLLPGVQEYVVFVDPHQSDNIRAVRDILNLLKQNKTVVTFPAGRIEPDPAIHLNATDSLEHWSSSIKLFSKHIPNLQIVPVTVGGVISLDATKHPLARLYRTQARRDWIAATLMILHHRYRQRCVTLRYGTPLKASMEIMVDVQTAMREMISQTWQAANTPTILD